MGRALWFAAGAGTALYGTIKARRLVYRVSAGGLADQVAALRLGAGELLDDIRRATLEREAEIVAELGLGAVPDHLDERESSTRVVALTPTAERKDSS